MPLSDNERALQKLTESYAPTPLTWRFWRWPRTHQGLLLVFLLSAASALSYHFGIGQQRHSPLPLSAVHAPWESSCQTCHVTLETSSLLGGSAPPIVGKVDPQRCQSCHRGATHHTMSQHIEDNCTTCHTEHTGRQAHLTRVKDSYCTHCHQDLDAKVGPNVWARFAPRVQSFSKPPAHPPFQPWRPPLVVEVARSVGLLSSPRSVAPLMTLLTLNAGRTLRLDPGNLAFDHALHMRAGLQLENEGRSVGSPLTYAKLPRSGTRCFTSLSEAEQLRLGFTKDLDAFVQLDCSSCHQLDRSASTGDFWQAGRDRVTRSGGATMLPVVFVEHCQVCHPLTFDATRPGEQVPHRRQSDELRRWLRTTYTDAFLSGKLGGEKKPMVRHPSPGKALDPLEPTNRQRIDDRVRQAEATLYRGKVVCGTCHQYELATTPGDLPQIIAPQVPEVWFRHARFSHVDHRGVDCRSCHADAYAINELKERNPTASTRSHDVLIPGIETCLQCHGRGSSALGWQGARSDCVQCHHYHNGDAPLSGRGSDAQDPSKRLDVDEFKFPWKQQR